MKKLNLGCGHDIHPDSVNLDKEPFPGVDVVHDINKPLPFDDDTFDHVHANQVLEHLPELIPIMNELWRILRPQGTLHLSVPWWAGTWARGDPTHIRFFDHNSFNPFSDWYDRYTYLHIKGRWKKIAQTYQVDPDFLAEPIHNQGGFSPIYSMTVLLRKEP